MALIKLNNIHLTHFFFLLSIVTELKVDHKNSCALKDCRKLYHLITGKMKSISSLVSEKAACNILFGPPCIFLSSSILKKNSKKILKQREYFS